MGLLSVCRPEPRRGDPSRRQAYFTVAATFSPAGPSPTLGGRAKGRYRHHRSTVSVCGGSGQRCTDAVSRCTSPTRPCPRPYPYPCPCPCQMETTFAPRVERGTGVRSGGDPEHQSARRRYSPVGEHHGDGEDRRAAQGRLRPARADRRRQARARPLRLLVRAGRLHGHRGRDGQHVRAASPGAIRNCPRWPPAAISTPSPTAASSTGSSACWRRWRWCAPSTMPASRRKRRSRPSTGPTRRARASPPR